MGGWGRIRKTAKEKRGGRRCWDNISTRKCFLPGSSERLTLSCLVVETLSRVSVSCPGHAYGYISKCLLLGIGSWRPWTVSREWYGSLCFSPGVCLVFATSCSVPWPLLWNVWLGCTAWRTAFSSPFIVFEICVRATEHKPRLERVCYFLVAHNVLASL